MSDDNAIKQQVREFYNRVGWQVVSDGMYQNARYEDLRPVSAEYIHRCHLRVRQALNPAGKYLLDAGCGPIQYPEYLTYSEGYQYRVCLDISIVALQEARKRIGTQGLFVVADVANLPFRSEVFDGEVSLHTLHHLPVEDQEKAYRDLFRVLKPGSSAVLVNGWTDSPLMHRFQWLINGMERISKRRIQAATTLEVKPTTLAKVVEPTGTYIHKQDARWLRTVMGDIQGLEFDIHVWRSVSVRFLRAVIHQRLAGAFWLRRLFALEERFPHFFGEKGQYPLVIIRKPGA